MTDIEQTKNTALKGSLAVGRNVTVGGRADISGDARFAHDVRVEGWLDARNIRGAGVGFFESIDRLNEAYPEPRDGWYALVGTELPAKVYRAWNGKWTDTGKTGGEPSIDYDKAKQVALDLETETDNRLKADKELEDAIKAETKAREDADKELGKKQEEFSEALSQESDERQEADHNLQEQLDTKVFDTDQIADGAITEAKMSPEMQKLIAEWEASRKVVESLPSGEEDIVTDINFGAWEDRVFATTDVVTRDEGKEYRSSTRESDFPMASSTTAGSMSAEDKRYLDDIKENGLVKSISEDEIEKITQ